MNFAQPTCDYCAKHLPATTPENEYGEYICLDCEASIAEAAYERLCEDYHDGGSTRFRFTEQPPRKGDLT